MSNFTELDVWNDIREKNISINTLRNTILNDRNTLINKQNQIADNLKTINDLRNLKLANNQELTEQELENERLILEQNAILNLEINSIRNNINLSRVGIIDKNNIITQNLNTLESNVIDNIPIVNLPQSTFKTDNIIVENNLDVCGNINFNNKFIINNDIVLKSDMIPEIGDLYSIGSPSKPIKHLYLSSNSLYINGNKVISAEPSQELKITTSMNQNLSINTIGSGTLKLQSDNANIILDTSGINSSINLNTKRSININSIEGLVFAAGNYIKYADQKIYIKGDLNIDGSLNITGTQTIINTEVLNIKDNTILLNSNQLSNPDVDFQSGIEILRGNLPKYNFKYRELGNDGGVFEIGEDNNLQPVATRKPSNLMRENGLLFWDSSNNNIDTFINILFDNGNINLINNSKLLINNVDILSNFGNIYNNNGNVGINNNNPLFSLDVSGDINLSGNLYKNGLIFNLENIGNNNFNNVESIATTIGMICPFACVDAPDGWLICDGRELSRFDYSELFNVIGTIWGSGNGSTTFNIPDLRDEFIRGSSNNRIVGSGEGFALEKHIHYSGITSSGYNSLITFEGVEAVSGRNTSNLRLLLNNTSGSGFVSGVTSNPITSGIAINNFIDGSANTNASISDETRPRNKTVLFCIKYTNNDRLWTYNSNQEIESTKKVVINGDLNIKGLILQNDNLFLNLRDDKFMVIESICLLKDLKTNGVRNTTAVSEWNQFRNINNISHMGINFASLSDDTITLPKGRYLFQTFATGYDTYGCKLRIINTANNQVLAIGSSSYARNGADTTLFLTAFIELEDTINIKFQYYVITANGYNSGVAVSSGELEDYFNLLITKYKDFSLIEINHWQEISGNITHNGDVSINGVLSINEPINNNNATTKFYVDNKFNDLISSYISEPIIKAVDSNNWNGYIAESSSIWGSSHEPYKAFDGNLYVSGSCWVSIAGSYSNTNYVGSNSFNGVNGEWIKLTLPEEKIIHSYSLYHRPGLMNYMASKWVLFGSIDNVNWILLDDRIQTATTNWNIKYIFNINNPINVKYITLVVLNTVGNVDRVDIEEIEYNTVSPNVITRYEDKIGINKVPSYSLDVSGDINLNGNLLKNGINIENNLNPIINTVDTLERQYNITLEDIFKTLFSNYLPNHVLHSQFTTFVPVYSSTNGYLFLNDTDYPSVIEIDYELKPEWGYGFKLQFYMGGGGDYRSISHSDFLIPGKRLSLMVECLGTSNMFVTLRSINGGTYNDLWNNNSITFSTMNKPAVSVNFMSTTNRENRNIPSNISTYFNVFRVRGFR
jgi:hypothetical protein